MSIQRLRMTLSTVLIMCIACGGAYAQTASPTTDPPKKTEQQPSGQTNVRRPKQPESANKEQKTENKTFTDCSQQRAMQLRDKAEGDPTASQNMVEYGGGG